MARSGLTPEQQRFIDEYLIDPNGTQAYRKAFPSATYHTARNEAAKLLAKPCIKKELRAAQAAARQKLRVSAERVNREVARIAFADLLDIETPDGRLRSLRDIPIDLRRAIASVKVRRVKSLGNDEETVDVVEYKLWPKMAAIESLMKRLGLVKEVTPLESLLAFLPPELGGQVRAALAAALSGGGSAAGGGGEDA